MNEIIKPKTPSTITISIPGGDVTDEWEVAAAFNVYFIKKINALKTGINPSLVRHPLVGISKKFKDKNLKFDIKPVSVNRVRSRSTGADSNTADLNAAVQTPQNPNTAYWNAAATKTTPL